MSGPVIQIAIDAHDPHAQSAFWAEVVGYRVERDGAFVQRMIDEGHATADDVVEIDGVLDWATASACSDPDGVRPRLLFQKVPEAKAVKNRVHLDLRIPADRRDAEIARLEALGATRLWDGRQGPQTWVTMADPEGNEFCLD